MKRPVLSICIPTYNRGETLAANVRVWLDAAPVEGLEIVVSDNASTDGTPQTFAEITDPRLVFVRGESNVGAFANQLRTFESASGSWVMQLTDKDGIFPETLPQALAELAGLEAACGRFVLQYGEGRTSCKTEFHNGAAAYSRFGLAYAHPSGVFFRTDVLRRYGLLDTLRTLDERTHPFSTDYLTSLCLRHGGHATVGIPFVRHNLPPYGAGRRSVSYDSGRTWYFTPEFVFDEFVEYVRFLQGTLKMNPIRRAVVLSGIVRRALLARMTEVYRNTLNNPDMCDWYGVSEDVRRRELAHDHEGYFLERTTAAAELGAFDAWIVRRAAKGRRKRIEEQRREHAAQVK